MSDSIIIGVDHGYAAMKTAHFAFPSGLVAYEYEPYTLSNVLEYGGKFYVVGSGRQPLQKDKTQAEDYYLLTLAAIAKELEYRNAGTMGRCPSGHRPAAHQFWARQESLPGLPVQGW